MDGQAVAARLQNREYTDGRWRKGNYRNNAVPQEVGIFAEDAVDGIGEVGFFRPSPVSSKAEQEANTRVVVAASRMADALGVIVLDERISAWLIAHDPKAYEQARGALDKALNG